MNIVGEPMSVGRIEDMAVIDNIVYIAGDREGLQIVDVQTTEDPRVSSLKTHGRQVERVEIIDHHAYLATSSGLEIINIENPLAPVRQSRFRHGRMTDLIVTDDALFSVGSQGMTVVPEASVTLLRRFTFEAVGTTLEYIVRWNDLYPETDEVISCNTTGGPCRVPDLNQIANTARVTWQLPKTAGDYEIAIAASNYHYYTITRDRITAEEPTQ